MVTLNSNKIGIPIAILALIVFLVSIFCFAPETVVVNTERSGGQINFDENLTRSVMNIGNAFADPEKNIAVSSPIGVIETGTGRNTFTMMYKNINDERFDGVGARFALSVTDAHSITHTATKEVGENDAGTISVAFIAHEAGTGSYLLESTIVEKRMGFFGGYTMTGGLPLRSALLAVAASFLLGILITSLGYKRRSSTHETASNALAEIADVDSDTTEQNGEDNVRDILRVLKGNEQKVVEVLLGAGALNQAELATMTEINKSTLSRTLHDMEQRGMIVRYENGMSKMVKLADSFKR
jgi:DNA-binding MarR family transcriptional regulator